MCQIDGGKLDTQLKLLNKEVFLQVKNDRPGDDGTLRSV